MVLRTTGGRVRQGSENLLWPELWGLWRGGNPGPPAESRGAGSLRAQAELCQPQGVRAFLGWGSPDWPPLLPAGPQLCLRTVQKAIPGSALGQDGFCGAGGLGGPSHHPSESRLPSLETMQGRLGGTAAQRGHEALRRAGSHFWLDPRGFLEPWAVGHPRQDLPCGAQRPQQLLSNFHKLPPGPPPHIHLLSASSSPGHVTRGNQEQETGEHGGGLTLCLRGGLAGRAPAVGLRAVCRDPACSPGLPCGPHSDGAGLSPRSSWVRPSPHCPPWQGGREAGPGERC